MWSSRAARRGGAVVDPRGTEIDGRARDVDDVGAPHAIASPDDDHVDAGRPQGRGGGETGDARADDDHPAHLARARRGDVVGVVAVHPARPAAVIPAPPPWRTGGGGAAGQRSRCSPGATATAAGCWSARRRRPAQLLDLLFGPVWSGGQDEDDRALAVLFQEAAGTTRPGWRSGPPTTSWRGPGFGG